MSGFLITLDSGTNQNGPAVTHDIRQTILNPKILNAKYSLALVSVNTGASWFNISASKQNNVFVYTVLGTHFNIRVPDGSYTFDSLSDAIHLGMLGNGHATLVSSVYHYEINFSLNNGTNFSTVTISDTDYTIIWNTDMRKFYGFNASVQTATSVSPNETDPFSGLQEIQVHCDLCTGMSIQNGRASSSIYSFQSNLYAPNEEISISTPQLIPIVMSEQDMIRNIRVWLTDQNDQILDLQGTPMSVTLYCQRVA